MRAHATLAISRKILHSGERSNVSHKGGLMRLTYQPLRKRHEGELEDALSALLHLYTEARRLRQDAWLSDERGLDYALADAQRTLQHHRLVGEVTRGTL